MLSRAALLLLSIWTLVLPLRHTLLDADWAIGSKHPFDGGALDVATTAAKKLVGGEANTTAALVAQVSLPLALVLAPSRRVGAVAAVGVAAWQWAMAASTVKPSKAAPLCLTRGLCSLAGTCRRYKKDTLQPSARSKLMSANSRRSHPSG